MKTKFNLYRTISKYFRFTLLITGVLYILTTTNGCKKNDNTNTTSKDSIPSITYSLSDVGGTWQRHSLVTTSSNSGYWIYGTIVNSNGLSSAHLTLPYGPMNGPIDTTFIIVGATMTDGVLTTASDPAAHTFISSDKNLMVSTTKRNGYTLVFDQKTVSGTIYGSADFQGTWQVHSIVGGGNFSGWGHAVSIRDNTGSCISNTVVTSIGQIGVASGGTTSISSVGTITMNGTATYNGFMSADKKLMTATMTDGGGGGGLSIAQKVVAGTTYSKADLQGTWQLHDILVGSENRTEHGIMTIDASGNSTISNMVKDDGGTFIDPRVALSISLDGIVTFGRDFHGFLSADKKLVIGTQSDDYSGQAYSLVALQKMP